MKILHISSSPFKTTGGVPVVLKNLVTAQNNIEGVEAKVLLLKANIRHEHMIYVEKDKVESFIYNYNPDIAIFHSFFYLEYRNVSKILVKHSIPYLIEPHSSFGKAAIKKGKYKKKLAIATLFYSLLKNAAGYIYLNRAEMIDSFCYKKNSFIIPNGISKLPFTDNKIKKDIIIYFIGRYDLNHKGIDYLLDALSILDKKGYNFTFKFWGDGIAKKNIHDKIAKYKNINATECGVIDCSSQDVLLESAGIMVLTSRYEGFPMSVLEAWSYGNPCIVTKGTNLLEEVKRNRVGWGTSYEPKDIAECIVNAYAEYVNNRTEYVLRCKKYVTDNYTWDKIATVSIDEYRKALNIDVLNA